MPYFNYIKLDCEENNKNLADGELDVYYASDKEDFFGRLIVAGMIDSETLQDILKIINEEYVEEDDDYCDQDQLEGLFQKDEFELTMDDDTTLNIKKKDNSNFISPICDYHFGKPVETIPLSFELAWEAMRTLLKYGNLNSSYCHIFQKVNLIK